MREYRSPEEYTSDGITPADLLMQREEYTDRDAPLNIAGIGSIPIDALAIFVRILLPVAGTPTNVSYWQGAARRLAGLAHALQIEPVRQCSLKAIADALGCSRALVSLVVCELRDLGSLDARAGRLATSRENYSSSTKAIWCRRGKAQAAAKKEQAERFDEVARSWDIEKLRQELRALKPMERRVALMRELLSQKVAAAKAAEKTDEDAT